MTAHACGFDPRNDCAACEAEERENETPCICNGVGPAPGTHHRPDCDLHRVVEPEPEED